MHTEWLLMLWTVSSQNCSTDQIKFHRQISLPQTSNDWSLRLSGETPTVCIVAHWLPAWTAPSSCSGHTTYVTIITVHSLRWLLWQARFDGVLYICYHYHLQNYDIMAAYKCAHLYILFTYLFNTEAYTALSCSKGGSHDRKCCCQSSSVLSMLHKHSHMYESHTSAAACAVCSSSSRRRSSTLRLISASFRSCSACARLRCNQCHFPSKTLNYAVHLCTLEPQVISN